MKLVIKKIKLSNFKGCKDLELELGETNEILGENGAGKTTVATAWLWLMSDRDYALKSNPSVYPLGVEECTPRVEFLVDIDGKELTLAKYQKKIKKATNSVAYSNSYEINGVEYGERDFKNKLDEHGVDLSSFLPLTHLEVYTNQKSSDMRKVLFEMASQKTDFEIAVGLDNCSEVNKLLEIYTMDEIKAMQNATMKKIKENYGKSGEILRAKIEGLESAKVDVDVAELELGKKALQDKLKSNVRQQNAILEEYRKAERVSDGILELNFKLSEKQRKDKDKKDKKRAEIREEMNGVRHEILSNELVIKESKINITKHKTTLGILDNNAKISKEQYINAKKLNFDENSLFCKYCGQEYPSEKKEKIKAEFELRKEQEMVEVIEKNNKYIMLQHETIEKISSEEHIIQQAEETIVLLNKKLKKLQTKLDSVKEINITTTAEYKAIKEKKTALETTNRLDKKLKILREEENELNQDITNYEIQMAKATSNSSIDGKIEELCEQQKKYEQDKANCEKILYQIELVNRKKNELLTDEINSHFELVDFKLFDYRKNGEYLECCTPMYKGKDLNIDTNTGLEILMKLDIIKGLQKFYKSQLPVFVDCAESLSKETRDKINMDCQITYLTVSENSKLNINGKDI